MGKYESIAIGDHRQLRHVITQADLEKFVTLSGDDNRLHTDSDYAATTSLQRPVVHGMLGAAFISTVIGTQLPGDGALWFAQNLEFLLPVRIGDEITVVAQVVKKNDRNRSIELQTDIFNHHGQKVTTGSAKVKIIEPEPMPEPVSAPERPKIALVVGASGGIGRAVCLRLAQDGFAVAVHYHRNHQAAQDIAARVQQLRQKAIVVSGDVSQEQQVVAMLAQIRRHWQALTVMVNCTTIKIAQVRFVDLNWEQMQRHLEVNLKGAFLLAQQVIPLMAPQNYGKIIHLTTQAIETVNAGWLPYITAKAGLHGFCKTLALELASKGITVNMVSPGMTATELNADLPEKIKLLAAAKTPLRRLAQPEDIANAVSFLASENADFITGETLRVNGGQVML